MSDRRAELEAAIEASPHEAGNYLVLADVLQQLGDPRGEAIVRWYGGTRGVRTEVEAKLGPVPPKFSQLDWFCGYVKRFRVYVDDEDPGAFHTFFGHPSMRFIQDIDLDIPGGRYAEDRQWLVEYLGRDKHPTVRSLTLNSYQRGGNQPPIGDFDLTRLWSAFPRLQSLIVNARSIDPGPLTSITLTSLTFDGEVTANAMQPLLDGSMPALQELVLWDVGVDFLERFAGSALEKQLTKVDLHPHNFDEDRYEQTGE